MMKRWRQPLLIALLLTATNLWATGYELTDERADVFGENILIRTRYEDTFVDLARRYSLGYEEIIRANPGVDPWLPGADTEITLPGQRILPPGPREGIVVNLPEHRLYYFPKPRKGEPRMAITYPVSIGKMDWQTPLGETHIVSKQKKPVWRPPASVRKEHESRGEPLPAVVPPGPDNPLGDYAMRLALPSGSYLIHGTNNPLAVGLAVTHGCIRMYPEDIAALFPLVPVGTTVRLIDEPVKVAFIDGELLLEVHPNLDANGQPLPPDVELLTRKLVEALGDRTVAIHWDLALDTLRKADGQLTVVGLEADLNEPVPVPLVTEVSATEEALQTPAR